LAIREKDRKAFEVLRAGFCVRVQFPVRFPGSVRCSAFGSGFGLPFGVRRSMLSSAFGSP